MDQVKSSVAMRRQLAILLDPRFMPICIGLFVLSRLVLILLVPLTPVSDAGWYFHQGLNIASGAGYVEQGHPTAFWPVGYPAFLGLIFRLFGGHVLAAQLANIALGVCLLLLVYRTAFLLFRDEISARIAMLLLTAYPNQMGYSAALDTETFYSCLLLAAIYLFIRRPGFWPAIAAGLLMGYAILTKSQTLICAGALIGFYGWQTIRQGGLRRALPIAGAFCLATVLVVAPWTIRNYAVFGQFVLVSTNGGPVLLNGNNPNATGGDMEVPDLPPDMQYHWEVMKQVEIDRAARQHAVAWMIAHPVDVLKLVPKKLWLLWARDGETEWEYQDGFAAYDQHVLWFRSARLLNQVYYLSLLALCAWAAVRLWRAGALWSDWTAIGFVVIAYMTLVSVLFTAQSRYHHPAMPWVIIYAAWQLRSWLAGSPSIRPADRPGDLIRRNA